MKFLNGLIDTCKLIGTTFFGETVYEVKKRDRDVHYHIKLKRKNEKYSVVFVHFCVDEPNLIMDLESFDLLYHSVCEMKRNIPEGAESYDLRRL